MTSFLIFLLLLITPFIVLPFGLSVFETPKVLFTEILIELIIFINLNSGNFKFQTKDLVLKLALLCLGLLSLYHLTISGFNPDFFWGNSFRLQGIFLLWNLIGLLVISHKFKLNHIPDLIYLLVLSLLLLDTILFGQNSAGRNIGSLGEPNSLAATALFFVPAVLFNKNLKIKLGKFIFKDRHILLVRSLAFLISFLIVFLSGSKSGFLGLSIISIIFVGLKLKISTPKLLIISLIILSLSLILPFIQGGGWFENRSEIWQTALASGVENPIFGSGFGNIESSLRQTSQRLNNNVQYQIVDSSHNIFLDFWVSGGMLGLGLFVLIISKFLLRIKTNPILISSFLGVLAVALFNPVSVVNLVEIWWLLGQF